MWVDEGVVDVVSDHKALLMNYSCCLNVKPTEIQRKKKWKLRDADWESFQQELCEEEWDESENVNECNNVLIEKIKKTAEKKIGMTDPNSKKKHKPWFTDEIKNERKERKKLNAEQRRIHYEFENGNRSEDEWKEAYKKYDKQQKLVKRMIKRIRSVYERRIVESMRAKGEEGSKNWHRFLRGEQCNNNFVVDGLYVNGETVRSDEKMKEAIASFWEEIGGMNESAEHRNINFNLPVVDMSDMDIKISKKEIESFLRKLKNEKASGPDLIPYEMFKSRFHRSCSVRTLWRSSLPDLRSPRRERTSHLL